MLITSKEDFAAVWARITDAAEQPAQPVQPTQSAQPELSDLLRTLLRAAETAGAQYARLAAACPLRQSGPALRQMAGEAREHQARLRAALFLLDGDSTPPTAAVPPAASVLETLRDACLRARAAADLYKQAAGAADLATAGLLFRLGGESARQAERLETMLSRLLQ